MLTTYTVDLDYLVVEIYEAGELVFVKQFETKDRLLDFIDAEYREKN